MWNLGRKWGKHRVTFQFPLYCQDARMILVFKDCLQGRITNFPPVDHFAYTLELLVFFF